MPRTRARIAALTRAPISPRTYRLVTLAALVAVGAIVVSGAAVRLTGSGMGCPSWPACEDGSLVPRGATGDHGWIEFVNRVFTGAVSVAVALAVLGSRRRQPQRPDLAPWAWGLVLGVFAQALLGGLVVVLHVAPIAVAGHYLLSAVLVANAVVLHHKASQPDGALQARATPQLLGRSRGLLALGALVLVTGTLVTGSGPHGGDEDADRLPFAVTSVARVHSVAVWMLLVLVGRRAARAHAGRRRAGGGRAGQPRRRRDPGAGHVGLRPVLHGRPGGACGPARLRVRGRLGGAPALPSRPHGGDRPTRGPCRASAVLRCAHPGGTRMTMPAPAPVEVDEPTGDTTTEEDVPWVVLVWNDPINLMSYVTFVLQKLFGYPKEKADRLMMQVHTEGTSRGRQRTSRDRPSCTCSASTSTGSGRRCSTTPDGPVPASTGATHAHRQLRPSACRSPSGRCSPTSSSSCASCWGRRPTTRPCAASSRRPTTTTRSTTREYQQLVRDELLERAARRARRRSRRRSSRRASTRTSSAAWLQRAQRPAPRARHPPRRERGRCSRSTRTTPMPASYAVYEYLGFLLSEVVDALSEGLPEPTEEDR